jgi:hypothetical protein
MLIKTTRYCIIIKIFIQGGVVMAITGRVTGRALKMKVNYGINEDGKVKTGIKNYGNLNPELTDEQIVAGAKALGELLEPVIEVITKVVTTQLIEG